jgi:hypothetical protein
MVNDVPDGTEVCAEGMSVKLKDIIQRNVAG